MGIQISTIRSILEKQSSSQPCYPLTPYSYLDRDVWSVDRYGLLTDLQILPEKLMRGQDDGVWFWWCDAQFLPFRDDHLFATTSCFMPRRDATWYPVPNAFNGRIQLIDVHGPDNIKCQVFSRTSSTVFPKVQPHPLGQLVAYCGTGDVVVMATDGDPVYSRSRDLTNAVHVYCAVGRNGVSLACLKRGMGVYFLETWSLHLQILPDKSIRCSQVCPNFIPLRGTSEFVACKFSPDSQFIAVSGSVGHLFVVRKPSLEKHCILWPGVLSEGLSHAESFDFNPRFPHEWLAMGTRDNRLQLFNIDTQQFGEVAEVKDKVDCLRYSPDGLLLAVALRNFDISVLNAQDLNHFHFIPMSELCVGEVSRTQPGYASVLNLSFTQDGSHLASSSCDGHLRIWRVPRLFSLQELCRNCILSHTAICRIQQLKMVPDKIRNFLLYKYF
ncbi:WD repeat and socs box-containing protein 1-like [Plakobranchus ocellatus]|uniref:WD repeat and socs box-containing protein 1-like n=1 Tax=Plakobranchus ocellatus TaxID=259542 RepID=A0AAV3Y3F6_9GAST|nr:WD repeat and socs box-containing protein 1-like [Plakobranchus ocellatus]